MSMIWWTAFSSEREGRRRGRRARSAGVLAIAALSVAVAGCGLLPDEPQEEDLSAIQLPQISKKPEYEVKVTAARPRVLQGETIQATIDSSDTVPSPRSMVILPISPVKLAGT